MGFVNLCFLSLSDFFPKISQILLFDTSFLLSLFLFSILVFFFFFFHLACVMEDQINMLIESVKFPDLFGPEIFLLMIFSSSFDSFDIHVSMLISLMIMVSL